MDLSKKTGGYQITEAKTFNNSLFGDVTTYIINDVVYFKTNEVAEILEITHNSVKIKMTRNELIQGVDYLKLTNDDISIVANRNFRKLHNTGELFLTKSGLYALCFKSKNKNAVKFRIWVTNEVLPQIEKTGKYEAKTEIIPQNYIEALEVIIVKHKENTALKIECNEKALVIENLEDIVEEQQPKVELLDRIIKDDNTSIEIGDWSKLIYKNNDINIGCHRLFNYLRMNKYLKKNNISRARYIKLGYFKFKETYYRDAHGKKRCSKTTLITIKGINAITPKLLKFLDEYEMIEQPNTCYDIFKKKMVQDNLI